jgi:hypothetical protein
MGKKNEGAAGNGIGTGAHKVEDSRFDEHPRH